MVGLLLLSSLYKLCLEKPLYISTLINNLLKGLHFITLHSFLILLNNSHTTLCRHYAKSFMRIYTYGYCTGVIDGTDLKIFKNL